MTKYTCKAVHLQKIKIFGIGTEYPEMGNKVVVASKKYRIN